MKITEFNDKLTQLEQLLAMEDSKIRLLQEKVGEYKELIKKFQDLEQFKQQALSEIRKENEMILKNQTEHVSQHLSELLKELTVNKEDKLNKTLKMLQKREEEIHKQTELLEKHTKEFIFLLEHNEILMMKLVNRRILTEHDVIEMQRRATKKAETTK